MADLSLVKNALKTTEMNSFIGKISRFRRINQNPIAESVSTMGLFLAAEMGLSREVVICYLSGGRDESRSMPTSADVGHRPRRHAAKVLLWLRFTIGVLMLGTKHPRAQVIERST